MSVHYLYYCKPEQAVQDLEVHGVEGSGLDHWASEQFKKLAPGDHLWIVSVVDGRLYLIGHLPVEDVLSDSDAVQFLGRSDIYGAEYHAVCSAEDAEYMMPLDIHDQAAELRFVSKKDRFAFEADGSITAFQMQTMRRLTEESVALLESLWYDDAEEEGDESGSGFQQDAEQRKLIEDSAVDYVVNHLNADGWEVVSVEAERCGYDLLCSRGQEELHVEVKGTSGTEAAFVITAQELDCARHDPVFQLRLVTQVLEDEPVMHCFAGGDVERAFDLKPVQYRAVHNPAFPLPGC